MYECPVHPFSTLSGQSRGEILLMTFSWLQKLLKQKGKKRSFHPHQNFLQHIQYEHIFQELIILTLKRKNSYLIRR